MTPPEARGSGVGNWRVDKMGGRPANQVSETRALIDPTMAEWDIPLVTPRTFSPPQENDVRVEIVYCPT